MEVTCVGWAALLVRGRLGKEGLEVVETGGTGLEVMGVWEGRGRGMETVVERKGIGWEVMELERAGVEVMEGLEMVEERKGIVWEVMGLERTGVEVMEGFGGGG